MRKNLDEISPGKILLEEFIKPSKLEETEVESSLGWPSGSLKNLVEGDLCLTPDMAATLGRYFNMEPEFWINLQTEYNQRTGFQSRLDTVNSMAHAGGAGRDRLSASGKSGAFGRVENEVTGMSEQARALLKQLQDRFPVFAQAQPLAIGIDRQLIAAIPGIPRKAMRIALSVHTGSSRYLKAVSRSDVRFNLDGTPATALQDTHRRHAAETLAERMKQSKERQRAAQKAKEDAQAD